MIDKLWICWWWRWWSIHLSGLSPLRRSSTPRRQKTDLICKNSIAECVLCSKYCQPTHAAGRPHKYLPPGGSNTKSIKRSWIMMHVCTLWHQEHGEHGGVGEDDCDGGWQHSNDGEDRCEIETGDSQLVQKHVQCLHPPAPQTSLIIKGENVGQQWISSCWRMFLTLLLGLWQLVLLYEPLPRSCNITSHVDVAFVPKLTLLNVHLWNVIFN